jgi:capsular exopolysaccharide synthesis family protein
MSRIEEALQRTTGGSHARGITSSRDAKTSDERTLGQYPEEIRALGSRPVAHESAASRTAVHESAATRPISAPRTGPRQLVSFDPALDGKLVVQHAAPFAVEQYRRLAAAMHELHVDKGLKTLMVTSALPREGKTLTVTNLALTLSESYRRRVLLVDADLRRPTIHEIFRLPNTRGLSEGLRPNAGELSVLEVSDRLSVLTAGQPDANPMAGLTSDRMQAVMAEAAARYDWVLLDAPPVGLMPDAHILARLSGAVLFVIAAGTTPYDLIQRSITDLGMECIVGTVLNRVDINTVPANRFYESYYSASAG